MKDIKEAATKIILEEGVIFFTMLKKEIEMFYKNSDKAGKKIYIKSRKKHRICDKNHCE